MSPKTFSQNPVIETLEPKLAPAGTIILATTAAGVLTITGDLVNNGISITDNPATGLWTITDPTATSTAFILNGVTQAASFTIPAQNSIKATMGDGNDTLRINPSTGTTGMILSGGLNYNGGKDNDVFSIGSTGNNQSLQVQGATVLDGGDGNDSVTVTANALFANTVDIKLGAGNDSLALSNTGSGEHTFLKGLKVDSGTGDDTIGITSGRFDVSGGNLTITGKGQTGVTQSVTLNPDFANVQGSVSIAMAAGPTTFSINSAVADQFRIGGNLTITGGVDDDVLNLRYLVHVGGVISVDLKDGSNSFLTNTTSAIHAGSLIFKGGKGADTVTFGANGSLDVLGALTLNLGAGDNTFNMGSGSFAAGSFNYTGGVDADTLTLSGANYLIRGNAAINTGAGTSNVTSAPTGGGAIGGNFLFTGGANFDNLTISNAFSVGGSTVLDLKDSQNIVTFSGGSSAVFNSFLQKGGKGVDVLTLNGTVAARGAFNLSFGEGTDTFSGGSSAELSAGSFSLSGGVDITTVSYDGTVFDIAGATVFNLGGGDNNCYFTALNNFSAGSLTVTSLAGEDDFFVTAGNFDVRGATNIKLGNGLNTTSLTLGDGDFNGAFTYTGGTGNDVVSFDNGALRINGGLVFKGDTGSNQLLVLMDTATIGSVNYAGGKDSDFLVLGISAGTSTRITVLGGVVANFAAGANNADITDTILQGALVLSSASTAGQTDDFEFNQSFFNGPVTVNMGGGDSFFTVNDTSTRGALLLNTGAGADDVRLDATAGTDILSTWFGTVTVNTGAGADDFFIGSAGNAGNVFQRAVIVDGGADSDTLTQANNSFNGGALQQSNIP